MPGRHFVTEIWEWEHTKSLIIVRIKQHEKKNEIIHYVGRFKIYHVA